MNCENGTFCLAVRVEDCGCSPSPATLTSYSENMERGGKYGEGSRGNLKQWHSQKSGMDSFLYRVDENMTASTYSLNKIPERNLESMSSHSAHSIPLYLMPRPNSVAGESLRPSCPFFSSQRFKKGSGAMIIEIFFKIRYDFYNPLRLLTLILSFYQLFVIFPNYFHI